MIVDKELIRLAGTNSLFKNLSENEVKSIIKPKNFYSAAEGKIIYAPGNEASEIYLIVEGEVKIKFSETRKVEHKIILDFFGEEEIMKNSQRISSAVVNKSSILYKIATEELKYITERLPVIQRNLSKEVNNAHNEDKNYLQPDATHHNTFDFANGVIDDSIETINFKEEERTVELSDEDLNTILEEKLNKKNMNK
jgi:CRP-like cAMP-binding protein